MKIGGECGCITLTAALISYQVGVQPSLVKETIPKQISYRRLCDRRLCDNSFLLGFARCCCGEDKENCRIFCPV